MFQEKIDNFFNEMQAKGYVAKQDFKCCNKCAWTALEKYDKFIFYHEQDTESIERGLLYIGWKGDGELIKQTAINCHLNVDWDGDEMIKILLLEE